MGKPIRSTKSVRLQKRSNTELSFEKLEEKKLLAGDLIQAIDQTVEVTDRNSFLRSHFDLDSNESMQLINVFQDQIGFKHYKYQQLFNDVPVETGVVTVHAKDGQIVSVSGKYVSVSDDVQGPVVAPTVSFDSALDHAQASQYIWDSASLAEQSGVDLDAIRDGELIYYTPEGGQPTLAYRFDVFSLDPFKRDYVFVDARTGSDVVGSRNRISNVNEVVDGDAVYETPSTVEIVADRLGSPSEWFLTEQWGTENGTRSRHISTLNATSASLYSSSDDTFDEPGHANAVQAHFGAETFYDYFYFVHGRDSYDDQGSELRLFVDDAALVNNADITVGATEAVARLGTGDGITRGPYVSLDIVGHEFTHAVVDQTANLFSSFQAGAIHESMADIFGTAVERYARTRLTPTWTIGEDVVLDGSGGFRSLQDPTIYSDPDTFLGTFYDATGADAHTNAGVHNKWFYLLSEGEVGTNDNGFAYDVAGIGFDEAAAIAYRNLSVYLNMDAKFEDARDGAIQSAIDLYGFASLEHRSTFDAWNAVGVGDRDLGVVTFEDFYDQDMDGVFDGVITNFRGIRPLGSQIHVATVSGIVPEHPDMNDELNAEIQTTQFFVELDANQTISAIVRGVDAVAGDNTNTLRPSVKIVSPGSAVISAASPDVSVDEVSAATGTVEVSDAGIYTIIVSDGAGATPENDNQRFGEFELEVYLNVELESETFTGVRNDDFLNAQQLDEIPIQLGDSDASRIAAWGTIDVGDYVEGAGGGSTTYFFEDFEDFANEPGMDWEFRSTNAGQIVPTDRRDDTPDNGVSLWMDSAIDQVNSLNEAIWTVDLTNVPTPHVNISFAEFADESDLLPEIHTGSVAADGISISVDDGITWYKVSNPTFQSENLVWDSTSYSLQDVADTHNLTLGVDTQIKFQQFGNYQIASGPGDGRGWDNIAITDGPLGQPGPPVGDWYEFTLEDGESASFVAAHNGLIFGFLDWVIDVYREADDPMDDPVLVASSTLSPQVDPDNVEAFTTTFTHRQDGDSATDDEVQKYFVNLYSDNEFDAPFALDYTLVGTINSIFDIETVDAGLEQFLTQADTIKQVWQVDVSVSNFLDTTINFTNDTDADFEPVPAGEEVDDYTAFGFERPVDGLTFDNLNGTQGVDGEVSWEYWDGTAWSALQLVQDGTEGWTAAVSDGQTIQWVIPSDWAESDVNGVVAYYARSVVTTEYTSNPDYDQGFVNGLDLSGAVGYASHGHEYTVEPDDFAPGALITTAIDDVIITSGNGPVYISHDITPDGFNAPTGFQVFTNNDSGSGPFMPGDGFDAANNPFYADFLTPQYEVSIEFTSDDLSNMTEGAILIAFDAQGNFITEAVASTNRFGSETLTVTSPTAKGEIAFVLAGGTTNSVILDNLTYTSEIDNDIYYVEAVAGDVIRWGSGFPAEGPHDFVNNLTDLRLSLFDPDGILVTTTSNFIEVLAAKTGTFELHVAAALPDMATDPPNEGEYYLTDIVDDNISEIAHVCSASTTFEDGVLNGGIYVEERALGVGYIMYTPENVLLPGGRFDSIHPDNAENFLAVRQLDTGQWQYAIQDPAGAGEPWLDFTPIREDLIVAEVSFGNAGNPAFVTSLEGPEWFVGGLDNPIRSGYLDGDLVFALDYFNGVSGGSSTGSFGIGGTYIINSYFDRLSVDVSDLNQGIFSVDRNNFTGYIMYSEEVLQDRFDGPFGSPIRSDNADHLMAVRFDSSSSTWLYTNRDRSLPTWRPFTPESTDILIADANFLSETITPMVGVNTTIDGIRAGIVDSDISYTPDVLNDGTFDNRDYGVQGTYFSIPSPWPTPTETYDVRPINAGISFDKDARGTGYILYTQESVYSTENSNRFDGRVEANNAEHLIAVHQRGSDGQWQFTSMESSGQGWRNFTPLTTDVLVAEINFNTDTINAFAIGNEFRVDGVAAGYLDRTIDFGFDDRGNADPLDDLFTVSSTDGTNWNITITEPQHEIHGDRGLNQPLGPLNNGVAVSDGATGTGYIMYSTENVYNRFRAIEDGNANRFVAVRFHDGNWEYSSIDDENPNDLSDTAARDSEGWLVFEPQLGDVLIAEVDFGLDTVNMLEDPSAPQQVIEGVRAGYIGGNLEIYANAWGGDNRSRGEFWIDGDYFASHCPPDNPRVDAIGFRPAGGGDSSGFAGGDLGETSQNDVPRVSLNNRFVELSDLSSGRSGMKYYDGLSNEQVFGSSVQDSNRMVIGEFKHSTVDSNQVGEVLFEQLPVDRGFKNNLNTVGLDFELFTEELDDQLRNRI